MTDTPYQASFFRADDLLPYREVITAHGERYTIHIYRAERPNYKGEMMLHAGYDYRLGGYAGPYPLDTDIPALIGKLKAMIAGEVHP